MIKFHKFFENKYQGTKPGINHRHRRAIPGSSSDGRYIRKHENIVPGYVKTDPSKNQTIEQLRGSTGKKVCGTSDLDYIRREYKVIPMKGQIKKLGSTGIQLYFDKKLKKFVLER
jgi:hypothetical protein|tara:strand:+ start:16731 stop:17075 length:345 start_codon:yes stop_codon:yes gene_type:complete